MSKELKLSTKRFNRWFDKVSKLLANTQQWESHDLLHDQEKDLKWVYNLAYEQGRRDEKKDLK